MHVRCRQALVGLLLTSFTFHVGCSHAANPEPVEGFALVQEHIVFAPHNVPPLKSELDFTLLDIDGKRVVYEKPPALVDMQPSALVPVGTHRFRARVSPHLVPAGYQPYDVSFVASVANRKIYYLIDKAKLPVLVEAKSR